jgi:hypothetical protein
LGKTARTSEEDATKTADVEEKIDKPVEENLSGAALDDMTALKIRLVLTDNIDYKLPPVTGD